METQREAALIKEIDTLRGELKSYQSREAEWERSKQERQQIDITERKRADQALRALSIRQEAILAAIPDILMEVDKDKVYTWVNPAGFEFFGEDVIGKEAAFYFEGEQDTYGQVNPLFNGNENVIYVESWQRRKDGEKRLLAWWCRVLKDSDGNVTGALSSAHDITDRKQAEDALRASEERYQTRFDYSPSALWQEDFSEIKGQIDRLQKKGVKDFRKYFTRHPGIVAQYATLVKVVDVNQAALDLHHAGSKEELLAGLNTIFSEEALPMFAEELTVLAGGKTIFEGEFVERTLTGNIINVAVKLSVAPGCEETWSKVFVSATDVTDRKQAENALRESEERWRSLVNATPDYIALHNQEGRFLFLNHYAEGFTEKDVIGSSLYQYLLPESVDIFRSSMEKALNTWTNQHFEHTALGDRGVMRMYDEYLVPLRGKNQEINIMAVSRDITERKQAEQALREYSTRLEADVAERTRELREAQEQLVRQEKLALLGQLAGGVGHELRNPLAVIRNAVYFLKLVQPDADEKVKEYIGMIEQETHTAEKIITDLLDFARIKSVDQEAVTVSELFQRVLKRYPAPPSVSMTLDIPPDLPSVYADPRQVEQVLGNLVLNAYQAMPAGGKLSISTVSRKDEIAIAVTDTGVGIPPENMSKLFEPLFTTKAKGIGLGLAVSKKLVEANAGRIEVESESGKGSTFTVYLPVAK